MKREKRKKGFIRNNLAGILAGMCYGVCGCLSALMADDWNGLGPIGSLGVALLLFVAAVLLKLLVASNGLSNMDATCSACRWVSRILALKNVPCCVTLAKTLWLLA